MLISSTVLPFHFTCNIRSTLSLDRDRSNSSIYISIVMLRDWAFDRSERPEPSERYRRIPADRQTCGFLDVYRQFSTPGLFSSTVIGICRPNRADPLFVDVSRHFLTSDVFSSTFIGICRPSRADPLFVDVSRHFLLSDVFSSTFIGICQPTRADRRTSGFLNVYQHFLTPGLFSSTFIGIC